MKIDIEDLVIALEDNNAEMTWYFDRESGSVIWIMNDFGIDDPDEEKEDIQNNPDRYIFINHIDSRTGYRIMEDFAMGLSEGPEREFLDRTLSWKKPFSNFKAALSQFPELKEVWFKHHDARLKEIALKWLAEHEIDFDD